jgi:hypothetical protein
MRQWKVVIRHNDKTIEKILLGERYSDVYVDILIEYPGCEIESITEIKS